MILRQCVYLHLMILITIPRAQADAQFTSVLTHTELRPPFSPPALILPPPPPLNNPTGSE